VSFPDGSATHPAEFCGGANHVGDRLVEEVVLTRLVHVEQLPGSVRWGPVEKSRKLLCVECFKDLVYQRPDADWYIYVKSTGIEWIEVPS